MPEGAAGFADHSGWAAMAIVTGTAVAPVLVRRARVQLCPDHLPRQPYHSAQGMPIDEAACVVHSVEEAAADRSAHLMRDLDVAAAAIGGGVTEIPPDLTTILSRHTLLHAAEGELYREALADAAGRAGLRVIRFVTRDVHIRLGAALNRPAGSMPEAVHRLGQDRGPPWNKDFKIAAAAAWLALAELSVRSP